MFRPGPLLCRALPLCTIALALSLARAAPLPIPAPRLPAVQKDAQEGICVTGTKFATGGWEVPMVGVRALAGITDALEVPALTNETTPSIVDRQTYSPKAINFTNNAMLDGMSLAVGDFPGNANQQSVFLFSGGDPGDSKADGRFFVLRARGYLDIKQRGFYTLAVQADDGYLLKVNGVEVLRSTEPFVSVRDSRQVRFPAPGPYPIEVVYYQLDAGAVLTLMMSEGQDLETRAESKPLGPSFKPVLSGDLRASLAGSTDCAECQKDSECGEAGDRYCGDGICQTCVVDDHCGAGCAACPTDKPVCNGTACVACTAARQELCAATGLVCNTDDGTCKNCATLDDCSGGKLCVKGLCRSREEIVAGYKYHGGCSAAPRGPAGRGGAGGVVVVLGALGALLLLRRRRLRQISAFLPFVPLTLLLTGDARAQVAINAQTLRPALGPDSLLTLESSQTPGRLRPFGNLLFEYAHQPLRLQLLDGTAVASPVSFAATAHVGVGFGILRWLSVGAVLPVVAYQGFDSKTPSLVTQKPGVFGLGDVRVIVKLRIRDNERGGLGAAFVPQASFPTGDATAFRGDDAYNIEGRFALDYRFRFGLTLLANAGFNYRTSDQVALLTRVSSTVRYGIGFLQRLPKDFSVFGEANAATSIYQEAGGPLYFPVEGYVGARYVNQPTRVTVSLGGGGSLYSSLSPPGSPLFRVFFSVGFLPSASWTRPKPDNTPKRGGRKDRDADGVFGDDDRCPEEAGPAENNGCPDTDEDSDGIVDRLDKCQDQAGPAENNGCPDADTDKDGIVDRLDKCPEKEGVKELDGCPDVDTDKDGVVDRLDKCVDKPGPKANDGCPEADEDGDGIIDRLDKCPKEPGPKVTGGCPDPDTDGDGIVDRLDKCPKEAGPKESGGCQLLSRQDATIRLTAPLRFAPGKDALVLGSQTIINALAKELKDPAIKKASIEVAGGKDKKTSKKLAVQRAKTLTATLLRAGVDKKVLLVKPAKGPGEDQVTLVSLVVDKKVAPKKGGDGEDAPAKGKKGKKGKPAKPAKPGKKKGKGR